MSEHESQDDGIGGLIARVVTDARDYAEAQIGYYKALAADRASHAKSAAILGVAALALIHLALIALVVGLVLTLATLVGPGLATLIVVLGIGLIGGLLGWLAARHLGRALHGRNDT